MPEKYPEMTLTVTEDHFKRAVPGDQCHCTIGEAVHDAMGELLPVLGFASADATSIAINPADVNGEPAVGVSFLGVREDGMNAKVRFILEEAAAFKVAYTTDNRTTGQMRKTARTRPYRLKISNIATRRERASTALGTGGRSRFTPEGHIKALASYAVQDAETRDLAMNRVAEKLEAKVADKTLPYKLNAKLRKFAETAVAASWENKGSVPNRAKQGVRVHHGRRFYS